ncbi:tolB protein precursor, periplasmic protein involved in the tonb-independent uptake of group A colicins [Sphingobium indicum BiD32]|uniref:TolB protein, periplasmic protein involved in the tonb-independent uptake of group A colicins n=1 Tax=Sphingobium indicum BiD32 TaxID=1301087 RepID=N1MG28_9SPHN|nr:amidohydrolase family protein [Sphingobium indicum]CCW16165.1 tolB protein precursor, periplasmic protein involved in the tonb-independent uptake of group A colicins [Sphingobium indicum BiD32]
MTIRSGVSRREAIAAGGIGLLAAGSAASVAQPGGAPTAGKETMVSVEDATNVALTLSPDGSRIAFDLLGILWTMPVAGGPLKRLTGDFDDLAQPDWSPDGTRIAFQSYRSGNFHIWSVAADGGDMRQHTDGLLDDREPRWSPDGKSIAFSSDRADGRYAIYLLDVASGRVTPLSKGTTNDSEPCWSPDGQRVAYVAGGTKLVMADVATGAISDVASVQPSPDRFNPSAIMAPAFAPDGRIAYTRVQPGSVTLVVDGKDVIAGEDLYPFRPAFTADGAILYGSGGKLRRWRDGKANVVPFTTQVPVTTPDYRKKARDFTSSTPKPVVGIAAPMLSPDGKQIVFAALNDLYLMPVGGAPRIMVGDAFHKCDPAWSPDGRMIAYSCDRGGTLDLWLHDVSTGKERQLTNIPDKAVAWGSWSQDGTLIAFLDQEGALHTVEVATGTVRKRFDAIWEPGRPSFGPDGQTIAYAAFKPVTGRYREGSSQILSVDLATGKGSYRPVFDGKSLGTRGHDGPVWSPDGKAMAFIFASTLWVAPVSPDGSFTGAPRQVSTELADAPSWSGDSRTLLYLSGGKLRLVPVTGGKPQTVPCRLTWANAKPSGRTVIRAGKVWDALSPTYKSGVDVVIDGNVITAVTPHGGAAPSDANARFIDAPDLTLMPGLIDMHTHRQMAGYGYGDRMGRLWLAMGITATRSPGCPAYHMVEDREAIQSGKRIAARHYATGEAIDGGRIFYNFMRPVTEPGQMALELERARLLDYDMVKTYVRLRYDTQKEVVDASHRMGMHLSSHYHYPALHSGMDCMEHTGATNRYGYSRTITALGGGYHDVNDLFSAAKAGRTPTLFAATALLGQDDSFTRDPRITTLYPDWELAKLAGRVKAMSGEGGAIMLASLERQVAQIKQMLAAGWRPLSGTDAPIDLTAISLHLNLRGMVKYGVSALDALMMTTRWSGEFLGEPIGRIERGMLADLILVEGDPLMDVSAVANVRQVVANGEVHTPDALMAPFVGAKPQADVTPVLPMLADAHQHIWWHDADYVEASRAACCAGHAVAHV